LNHPTSQGRGGRPGRLQEEIPELSAVRVGDAAWQSDRRRAAHQNRPGGSFGIYAKNENKCRFWASYLERDDFRLPWRLERLMASVHDRILFRLLNTDDRSVFRNAYEDDASVRVRHGSHRFRDVSWLLLLVFEPQALRERLVE
jgi:hypothetical protein